MNAWNYILCFFVAFTTNQFNSNIINKNKADFLRRIHVLEHFSLCVLNEMLVFRTGIHKMDVRIANTEDPERTASGFGCLHLGCFGSQFYIHCTDSVRNFRTFTVILHPFLCHLQIHHNNPQFRHELNYKLKKIFLAFKGL